MNKYLIDILKLRNSITLPGFGALMIANSKTGKIIINKFVKYDDGVLAKFIAEKEGIELIDAKNLVAKFVKEINAEVEKGGTYSIYEFGDIAKNDKDELIFTAFGSASTPNPKTVKSESVKKESKINKEEKLKGKEELKKVEKVKKVKEEVIKKPVDKVVAKKDLKTPITKASTSKVTEIKDKVLDKKENVFIPNTKTKEDKKDIKPVVVPTKKEDKNINKKIVATTTSSLSGKEKVEADKKWKNSEIVNGKVVEKKKKKRWLPILLLLLLLGGIGFGGYKYQNKIKSLLGMGSGVAHHDDETEEEHEQHANDTSDQNHENTDGNLNIDQEDLSHDNTDEDTINGAAETNEADNIINSIGDSNNNDVSSEEDNTNNSTANTETNDAEQIVETANTISSYATGSYHIIGGGFGIKSNAEAYAAKHGGTVLGRFDQLYLVALKSYDSRADAKADLSNVKSIAGSAWIFKYSN